MRLSALRGPSPCRTPHRRNNLSSRSRPERETGRRTNRRSDVLTRKTTTNSFSAKPCARISHDHKRHGTITLFAALNVLDGTVIGRNMQRHRHQEFIRFLNEIDRSVPVGGAVHRIRSGRGTRCRVETNSDPNRTSTGQVRNLIVGTSSSGRRMCSGLSQRPYRKPQN